MDSATDPSETALLASFENYGLSKLSMRYNIIPLKRPENPETPENPENPEIGLQAKLHVVYAGPASRSTRAAPTGGSAHPWRAWYWLLLKLVYQVGTCLGAGFWHSFHP